MRGDVIVEERALEMILDLVGVAGAVEFRLDLVEDVKFALDEASEAWEVSEAASSIIETRLRTRAFLRGVGAGFDRSSTSSSSFSPSIID